MESTCPEIKQFFVFKEFRMTLTSEGSGISLKALVQSTYRQFSCSLSEEDLKLQFCHIALNPKKVILSLLETAFKMSESEIFVVYPSVGERREERETVY